MLEEKLDKRAKLMLVILTVLALGAAMLFSPLGVVSSTVRRGVSRTFWGATLMARLISGKMEIGE